MALGMIIVENPPSAMTMGSDDGTNRGNAVPLISIDRLRLDSNGCS